MHARGAAAGHARHVHIPCMLQEGCGSGMADVHAPCMMQYGCGMACRHVHAPCMMRCKAVARHAGVHACSITLRACCGG